MSEPLISIVLPTYNGARYIRESIESCLAQTFQQFELIIVNDCSTDETPSIIQEYAQKDSRIHIINNEFNKKLPLSLNTGFESAVGTFFTWTSDDNKYAPTALEEMVAILQEKPNIDLIYCDYTLINSDGNVTGVRSFGDVTKSFNQWLGCGACFLYKREIHSSNNGYNPAAFLIEDYDFFVRAYTKFSFVYLPKKHLYFYREHDASLTTTQKATINDISKIFLERNLVTLESKLNTGELKLLYRKFAVYYAVAKNNIPKYGFYLKELNLLSRSEATVTVLYIFVKKLILTFTVGFSGIVLLIKYLIKGGDTSDHLS